tara:strand:- start:144 stop:815 length:672 start_codon:yes stop_codon:yes gene_type:complete
MISLLNTVSLGLFFLYFVLISGSCGEILNCGLRRYIDNSIWFKHLMIFLSIYIFTFILNWYTIDSIVVENNQNIEEKKEKKETVVDYSKLKYLYESLLYSLAIYIIFLMSTKAEGKYLATFLILSVVLVIIQIVLKALYGEYAELDMKHIFKSVQEISTILDEQDLTYDNNLIIILKSLPFVYFSAFIVLLVGLFKYYTRQRRDHSKNWDIIKFIFGNNKCNM